MSPKSSSSSAACLDPRTGARALLLDPPALGAAIGDLIARADSNEKIDQPCRYVNAKINHAESKLHDTCVWQQRMFRKENSQQNEHTLRIFQMCWYVLSSGGLLGELVHRPGGRTAIPRPTAVPGCRGAFSALGSAGSLCALRSGSSGRSCTDLPGHT